MVVAETLTMITPSVLGFSAFVTGSWLIDTILKKTDEPGVDIESVGRTIIKILQIFGMILGILCFATLIAIPVSGLGLYNDFLTLILLGIIGFVLLIAPFAKFPWAAMVGLVIGIIVAAAVAFLTPAWIIALIPFDFKWIIIAVFIIIGLIVFISLKWIEDIIKGFAMLLASRPVTIILAVLGIVQAALIIFFPGGILGFLPI